MLDWRGDRVARAAMRAVDGAAFDVVTQRAIPDAAQNTPVLTGAAVESLFAEEIADGRIEWGYGVDYGIFIEIGDRGRPGKHALRRAGDAHYPEIVPVARARFGR